MGLVHTEIKYPCVQWNILLYFFMLWAYISCWRSWTSCLNTWHHGFYQYQQIKNQQVTDSVRNLIMGMFWIFNRTIIQNQKHTKIGHWAQKPSFCYGIPVLWPEPCRKWSEVNWREEGTKHVAVKDLKDLERFWVKKMVSDLLSGVLQTLQAL